MTVASFDHNDGGVSPVVILLMVDDIEFKIIIRESITSIGVIFWVIHAPFDSGTVVEMPEVTKARIHETNLIVAIDHT